MCCDKQATPVLEPSTLHNNVRWLMYLICVSGRSCPCNKNGRMVAQSRQQNRCKFVVINRMRCCGCYVAGNDVDCIRDMCMH